MATWTSGSIATQALRHVQDVPSAVSGNATLFAEESIDELNNFLRISLGTTGIDGKYHPALVNMTAAKMLGNMLGVGAGFGFSLGEFTKDSSSQGNEYNQLKYHLEMANNQVRAIEKPMHISLTNG